MHDRADLARMGGEGLQEAWETLADTGHLAVPPCKRAPETGCSVHRGQSTVALRHEDRVGVIEPGRGVAR